MRKSFNEAEAPLLPEYLQIPILWKYQTEVRERYKKAEVPIAILIGGNFLANIVEATIDPQKTKHADVFRSIELSFNLAFTLELIINMYAYWFKSFWKSNWSRFDFVVVSIGLLTMTDLDLPGPLTLLRNMRAFRVFRLFKRIESLRKILEALARAVPGVINAFFILLLVMSIYSILAVEFWSTFGAGGMIVNERGDEIEFTTSRGQDYGFEYFGNFPKSLFTMFQVMSTDSWAEAVARPLMSTPDSFVNLATAFYFLSFQILCETILINVVVAVLLDKMMAEETGPPQDDTPRPSELKSEGTVLPSESEAMSPEQHRNSQEACYGSENLPNAICEDVDDIKRAIVPQTNFGKVSRKDLVSESLAGEVPEDRRKQRVQKLQSEVEQMGNDICEVKGQVVMLLAILSKQVPEIT